MYKSERREHQRRNRKVLDNRRSVFLLQRLAARPKGKPQPLDRGEKMGSEPTKESK